MMTSHRINLFFLDESGNTGDATHTGVAFDFDKQPIFVLACLGIADDAAFAATFARLKAHHHLRAPEVKSDAVWKKPAFFMDLLTEIEVNDLPLMLEIVDKRFFIAAQMVNSLILPSVGSDMDHSPKLTFMRNSTAEFLTEILPTSCLATFVEAFARTDGNAILQVYDSLLDSLDAKPADGINDFVRMAITDGRNNFIAEGINDPEVIQHHLPIPDLNPHGKPVWMLPHLTSFTNLYARLNTYTGGKLHGVTLIHDEQLQFGDILKDSKMATEALTCQGVNITHGSANYVFEEQADFIFQESGRSAGIQAADVIAGYAMRLIVNRMTPEIQLRHDGDWQLQRLLSHDDPDLGTGTNFVMTAAKLRKIGITSAADPFQSPW